MNHLLIDFENIQPNNLDKLDDENTHIWLFLGANQQKKHIVGILPIALPFW